MEKIICEECTKKIIDKIDKPFFSVENGCLYYYGISNIPGLELAACFYLSNKYWDAFDRRWRKYDRIFLCYTDNPIVVIENMDYWKQKNLYIVCNHISSNVIEKSNGKIVYDLSSFVQKTMEK